PAGPGPAVRIPVDTLILTLGFTGPDTAALSAELGVALDTRGNIAIDPHYATSAPGVFCAGDAHRGASLIVWAIAEGRELARRAPPTPHGAPPLPPPPPAARPCRSRRDTPSRLIGLQRCYRP